MINKSNQIFDSAITEIIKKRISVRAYKPEALDETLKNKIISYLSELKGPFDAKVKFKLVDSNTSLQNNIKLGTYGVIRGASSFIASAVENSGMGLEELGYELEKLVLYAASLGLGTCWMGGTFKKGEFAKAIELKEGELLPIVIPVGYPSENKNIIGSFLRMAAGSKNRKGWEEIFFDGSFEKKLSETTAGPYSVALEMLRLAPSASNKQPWRVVKDGNRFHFYLSHNVGYAKGLGFDMQRIDIGIAICHFDLTLKESGITGHWKKCEQSIKPLNNSTEYIVSWVQED
jgi:nitroreductase